MSASDEEDSEWLEIALQYGGNQNLVNPSDYCETPIYDAIRSWNEKNVNLLIDAGADLDHPGNYGQTPCMYAAGRNRFDMVYRLLEAGADHRIKHNYGKDLAYEVIDT